MSQSSEEITETKNHHTILEYYSDSDSELEEGSTTSEEDTFLSIRYPSPPYFPTPYLCNWDFRDPQKAFKYIMKHFNIETIHNSVKLFPDLSKDFIYSNTYGANHLDTTTYVQWLCTHQFGEFKLVYTTLISVSLKHPDMKGSFSTQ